MAVSAIVMRSIGVTHFLHPVAGPLCTDRFDHSPTAHEGAWFANARATIGILIAHSGLASGASRTTHAHAKCIIGAKERRAPKVAELIDLYWDGGPKVHSLRRAAGVGSAVFVVGCQFCGT